MGYVKLTRMMLLFEYHGAELGFGAHNREILDYIKSELSGLEKSLRAGEVQIEDLDETTFEDFKAFLGGYAFRQSFANLNPYQPLYFHHQDGAHPDLKRRSFTQYFHVLLEMLEPLVEKTGDESLGRATRARRTAINDFRIYYRYRVYRH